MTVAAINTQSCHVMLMAEWHWLWFSHARECDIRRSLYGVGHPAQSSNHEHRTKNRGARQSIRTAMKDLRHALYEIWLKETTRSVRVLITATFGLRENHPRGFPLIMELVIINISFAFVAFFEIQRQKKS
jgi:hypothetical protein